MNLSCRKMQQADAAVREGSYAGRPGWQSRRGDYIRYADLVQLNQIIRRPHALWPRARRSGLDRHSARIGPTRFSPTRPCPGRCGLRRADPRLSRPAPAGQGRPAPPGPSWPAVAPPTSPRRLFAVASHDPAPAGCCSSISASAGLADAESSESTIAPSRSDRTSGSPPITLRDTCLRKRFVTSARDLRVGTSMARSSSAATGCDQQPEPWRFGSRPAGTGQAASSLRAHPNRLFMRRCRSPRCLPSRRSALSHSFVAELPPIRREVPTPSPAAIPSPGSSRVLAATTLARADWGRLCTCWPRATE